MYNVCRWIEEVAIASKGGTPATNDVQVQALQELGRNWRNMSGRQFVETLTTAQFADYFTDALSRQFLKDYQAQTGSWQSYIATDQAPDFRNVKRFRKTVNGTMFRRGEKGEAEAMSMSIDDIEYGVVEWTRQMDISWRVILNDDLGEIRKAPQDMANMAADWKNQFVSALYDNATTQATLAGLGVPWSGTGRLTAPNLAIGLNAMMQRTNALGNPIVWRKVHLVIPTILQIQVADILKDLLSYGGVGGNVLMDFISLANVHVDPYITTAGANVPWYLFADPSEGNAVTLVSLAGMNGPAVLQKKSDVAVISGSVPAAMAMGSFATGDIEYMVDDIVGAWDDASYVGTTDFRAIYYSSGTTP